MGQFLAPRITTASRLTLTLSASELVYDTDLFRFFGGDGSTVGGFAIGSILGSGTANQISYFTASGTIASLSTTTYPNLTELSYIKGLTSSIQTQLGAKQASSTNLTSLSGLSYGSTSFVKMTAAGTFALDTNSYLTSITLSDVTTALGYTPVTNARTLTINGTTQDLTANRTWSVGDVVGPSSATDNAIVRFDTTTGKLIQNSGATIDDNNNITANATFNGFTTVVASATPIVLTAASTPVYYVSTGVGPQVIQLPVATTLPKGTIFSFNNNQSGSTISVNNNSGTLVKSVPSGAYLTLELTDNTTAVGGWDAHFQAPSNAAWSTNTLDWAGSFTSGTWNGNVVQVNRGGTGASTLTGVVIGNASSAMTAVSSGTANQLFRVNTAGTGYEFFTPSYITSAIASLNGLTGATQTFVNDTNVTMVSTGTTHTITWSGTLANSRLATMANNTIKGNVSGSTASPSDLTGTQVTAILDLFSTTTTTKGLVPGSNSVGSTYFLNANGSWAVPAGGGGTTTNSFIIKADSGITEGTDLYTFNGSSAKTINIVAGTNITITKTSGQLSIASTGGGATGASLYMLSTYFS
jgi:hypothetical protein